MKLRLKENPQEWFKFTALAGLFVGVVGFYLRRRGFLNAPTWMLFLPGVFALGIGVVHPRWIRAFYRMVMTASHHVGSVMGTILLSLFFFLVLTPMGWVLRLSGKDLLNLKKKSALTYWRPAKNDKKLDQLF